MANAAAKMFTSYLDSKEMRYDIGGEQENIVKMSWKLDNTSIKIYFDFDENNSYVHILGVDFIQIAEEKFGVILDAVNDCNNQYRWIKFCLNKKDREVTAECDAVIQLDTCAEEVYELMIRMTRIVDGAYPTFMKAMWA